VLADALSIPSGRTADMAPPLDTEFLADIEPSRRTDSRRSLRQELGLSADAVLLGITARIQRRRRWGLLWSVLAKLAESFGAVHLVVLGRPDEGVFDAVCRRPLAELGITSRVHFIGYRRDAAYADALLALDVFLLLVPGSDATCRALREAMALGLPVVVGDRQSLPLLVRHGETGLLAADVDDFTRAVTSLLQNDELRRRLAQQAARFAGQRWSREACAAAVLGLYQDLGP
jgi:glycosyltransferase involved in cell wall biosynthesis